MSKFSHGIIAAAAIAAFSFSPLTIAGGGYDWNGAGQQHVQKPATMNFGTDFDWNNQSLAQGVGQGEIVKSQSGVSDMINVWQSGTVQTDGCPGGCGTGNFSMGFDAQQQAGNQVHSVSNGIGVVNSAAGSQTQGFSAFGGQVTFPAFGK